ncbi:hypothetical protein GCM10008014_37040 [Paenibacillus silvae]|uniref:PX domain-containing protein n=1 Tax=Paenibacillus silvae TaxID=1325358 RepID=A0ABQ1ZFU9_9BACL|nr:hypothetical protein [Paenibacillus silvae]GGH61508.1 hypothetical protein GCM10008014_37040 [Paenibacillus silvae]
MNRRQRSKIVPNTWIIAAKQTDSNIYYALYAIDWKRGARLSWEGWKRYEDFLQFHVPFKRKMQGHHTSSQPAAKIAKKALYLHLNEAQYEELEQLFYQPFSRRKWRVFWRRMEVIADQ